MKNITVLAGGVGGARFVRGLLSRLAAAYPADTPSGSSVAVTVVANTGDDMWLNGLRVCPDLDTLMYTLGGGIAEEQGWGRAGESRRTSAEIAAYGRGWDWFTLGDLDLATHIVRSELLREGATLSQATEFLCRRWRPGARLLPMSDQPVETHVKLAAAADEHAAGDLVHFEEWWVRYRAGVPAAGFVQVGLDSATAAPGVVEAILEADAVIVPPSNPVVSVGTILAVPGIGEAVRATAAPVVGVSPIIGGAAVRGMADACLAAIGVPATAAGVGFHYGARNRGGLLDGWLVDTADADAVPQLEEAGIRAAAVPLWMTDVPATTAMAAAALELVPAPAPS
ncbi:2-phospho-L-lactate transferase [Arthrobacter sp. I2-34]|uniref:2-phospho-L-lactate transferase n=1 Tax=Arthrobacter hankyongi TaxID=2904801 RepID=A0ABS9L9Z0_9MICC|nr:2-phospho-L-lactate transferase [Arthrobacter hankyongi]MCG2623450.1 2-phospho-L-lactate transferase [Arthrobacter hankyongi]